VQALLLAIALTAGGTQSANDEEARKAFKEATQAYDAGNYDAAAKGYLLAYQLSKRGELLFAIALSYRDGGHLQEAREYYERYLSELPNGKSHDLAAQQLTEVQQKLAAQEAAKPPPLAEPQKPNEAVATTTKAESGPHPSTGAIVLGSVGIAAGVLAIVAIIEATSFQGWQSHPPGTVLQVSDVQSRVNSANTWATVSLVSAIAAGAGIGGAALTW
jgi:tetratricopeptide (TPR) repeat protein